MVGELEAKGVKGKGARLEWNLEEPERVTRRVGGRG